jgi:hypothetical protein
MLINLIVLIFVEKPGVIILNDGSDLFSTPLFYLPEFMNIF